MNFIIDPLNKFVSNGAEPEDIVNSLGMLPHFLAGGNPDVDAKTAFNDAYCCGLHEMTGGTVSAEGVFKYPNDADMYPYAKVERKDEIIYFYRFSIVAIVSDTSTFVTRMD